MYFSFELIGMYFSRSVVCDVRETKTEEASERVVTRWFTAGSRPHNVTHRLRCTTDKTCCCVFSCAPSYNKGRRGPLTCDCRLKWAAAVPHAAEREEQGRETMVRSPVGTLQWWEWQLGLPWDEFSSAVVTMMDTGSPCSSVKWTRADRHPALSYSTGTAGLFAVTELCGTHCSVHCDSSQPRLAVLTALEH